MRFFPRVKKENKSFWGNFGEIYLQKRNQRRGAQSRKRRQIKKPLRRRNRRGEEDLKFEKFIKLRMGILAKSY